MKRECDFDLNADEAECMAPQVVVHPSTLLTPIPIIASSRGSPALRCAPLDFEGERKCNGSASTSAFHHAPTRRTLEHGDKMSSTYASSNGSKQKYSSCKINLNASIDEIDAAVFDYTKNVPISGGLHSSESSVEGNLSGASAEVEQATAECRRLKPIAEIEQAIAEGGRPPAEVGQETTEVGQDTLEDGCLAAEDGSMYNFQKVVALEFLTCSVIAAAVAMCGYHLVYSSRAE